MIDEEGVEAGSVTMKPANGTGVRIELDIEGLSPGMHAVHLHSRGRCQPPGFFSAGGHFDPAGSRHGKPDGDADFDDPAHHAGDMLNQRADQEGAMKAVIVNQSVSLVDGGNELLDEDGSALVVYATADDYVTQPSGRAGRRIACAELTAR